MAPLKESTNESLQAVLRVGFQYILPIGMALLALMAFLRRPDRVFAGILLLALPVVLAAIAWRWMRPPPKADEDAAPPTDEVPAQVLAGLALLGTIAMVLLLRFADPGRMPVLLGFGLAITLAVFAVLLGRQRATYAWAGLAVALLTLLYVLYTTTTKAFYFGGGDLFAFFPSVQRLVATGDLDRALPAGSAYENLPFYFLFAAGGSFVTDGNVLHSLFQLFSLFFVAMGLALVAMMRRLGMPDRLAWIAFTLCLISRPLLMEATYPTPRSLAVFLLVVMLMVACVMAIEPEVAQLPVIVVLVLLGIGLAFVHKVSGFMAVGPLLLVFVLASLFLPPIEKRVRRTALWALGFILVLHVTNSLFTTRYLREALRKLADFGDSSRTATTARIVRWTWGNTADFLLDNLAVMALMFLVVAGCIVLLRRPDEHRIRNSGMALLAYLAMQTALLSPLYLSRYFTTTVSIDRLAPAAFLFCAVPAAMAYTGLAQGRRAGVVEPARLAVAGVFFLVLVAASFSAGVLNQDLGVNRRDVQPTTSFSEPELAAILFGEKFTSTVMSDRLVNRYYITNPFTHETFTGVRHETQVPTAANAGYLFVRYPEIDGGYTQARIGETNANGDFRYSMRLTSSSSAYGDLIEAVQEQDSLIYDSGEYEWFRYIRPASPAPAA